MRKRDAESRRYWNRHEWRWWKRVATVVFPALVLACAAVVRAL